MILSNFEKIIKMHSLVSSYLHHLKSNCYFIYAIKNIFYWSFQTLIAFVSLSCRSSFGRNGTSSLAFAISLANS